MTKRSFLLVIALALLAAGLAGAAPVATSTFDNDNEGWRLWTPSVYGTSWDGASGQPPGSASASDPDGGWTYWLAPGKFVGNLSACYGATLTYDLVDVNYGTPSNPGTNNVVLDCAAGTLTYRSVADDLWWGNGWKSFTVSLSASPEWLLNGGAVTAAQFKTALGSVSGLKIRGEFIDGGESMWIDNVVLNTVPEASTGALLLALVVPFAAMLRRARS